MSDVIACSAITLFIVKNGKCAHFTRPKPSRVAYCRIPFSPGDKIIEPSVENVFHEGKLVNAYLTIKICGRCIRELKRESHAVRP